MAAEWHYELLGGADDVFGKTQQDRERKRYDGALRKIGQLTVERDFLRRLCDGNGVSAERF